MIINDINRKEIERTKNLAGAVKKLFNLDLERRLCIFTQESMEGEIAKAFNELGLEKRQSTYKKIAEDFKKRTNYRDKTKTHNLIFDIGCGSGLLSLELAEKTNAVIYGIDLSKDMISLANVNRNRRAEDLIQKIIKEYENGGYDFSRPIPSACDIMPEIVDISQYNKNRVHFVIGDVYALSKISQNKEIADFIVCRNALHRFREPEKAIKEMYSVLKNNGKIYIRDLRRDANWETIIKRIGEERWKNPILVKDYIGAMASMLTTNELEKILKDLKIKNFDISDGNYRNGNIKGTNNNLKEYENEVEYVCIIRK